MKINDEIWLISKSINISQKASVLVCLSFYSKASIFLEAYLMADLVVS